MQYSSTRVEGHFKEWRHLTENAKTEITTLSRPPENSTVCIWEKKWNIAFCSHSCQGVCQATQVLATKEIYKYEVINNESNWILKEITSSICTLVKSKWLFFFFKKIFGEQELCIFIELQMCTIFLWHEMFSSRKEEQGDILIVLQLR